MTPYCAKLLLFGEYGLFYGAKALAVPFPGYRGAIVRSGLDLSDPVTIESMEKIRHFVSWFTDTTQNDRMNFPLDLDRLQQDILERKFYFDSTIPVEYGVGSSAALCAAIFHDYSVFAGSAPDRGDDLPARLRNDFALMESCFHGKSSGFDPLVSFYNRPILLEGTRIVFPDPDVGPLPFSVYLTDTGAPGPTAPLVRKFLTRMEDPAYANQFHRHYLPANDGAIQAFLSKEPEELFVQLRRITRFELDCFPEMIPPAFVETIRKSLKHDICYKLLGSGGGGFLLAFVPPGADHQLPAGSRKVF